ncbi:MAG: hypothetical protein GC159_03730 [Phycisphaera sp.]|nr:hypothetical protein [Phycisphaera sp.]
MGTHTQSLTATALAALLTISSVIARAADVPEEFIKAGEARRAEIPLGGDFKPDPKQPVFVAVGHGARILLSRDDGKTWTQVFFGYPGADHGGWATNCVAYAGGVFVVPVGWTQPTSYLASEDGVHWRHLTDGKTVFDRRSNDPRLMPTALSMAGGHGVFVASGYMDFTATPDLGHTWTKVSLWGVDKNDPRGRKLVTHHIHTVYCGDASGRFLALGNDRSKENTKFGNLFASDDLGQTWTWIEPKGLDTLHDYEAMICNGKVVVITDAAGANAYRSLDFGNTWEGPFETGATGRPTLSLVGDEFWVVGKTSRASADGVTWRDLPAGMPSGKIVASESGALININRGRMSIMRSGDRGATWQEVFTYEPPETEFIHGGQGLRDAAFGYITATPVAR